MNIDLLISNRKKFGELIKCGQSPWLDNISRCMIDSGELKLLVDNNIITGITSNPSIFEKAIDSGKCNYPETIKKMSSQGLDTFEVYDAITQRDIKDAAKILYPIYEKTHGKDGFVSIEVPPDIATDTETSIKEADRIFHSINEPNLLIKIPATTEGLSAIARIIGKGINVNVTLMFSITHYINVADAYMEGLEMAHKNGIDINKIHSVASVFISRLDTMIDNLLDNLLNKAGGDAKNGIISLKGQAAVANAKIIYNKFTDIFNGERFKKLESMGANIQRPLWASTSTKNPDYYDLKYVEPLVAKNTVNTLPEPTIESIADHGNIKPDTAELDVESSGNILNELKKIGIDTEQAGEILQKEGVKSFEESYNKLLDSIKNV
ncbi:MAG: transaldolase [Candidatus Acididesulfobacter guangdongensis]|uniref:Transaldolase n=1 Tax=Acididesulfobacter guangdongensis TaxID=2597225 RepID=A0A519BIF8_ACIG2|nr:MAG: transaldolase [Candidatus Acididesulfobacter guangdongensis]